MTTKANRKPTADFVLPYNCTQNPTHADFPRQLILFNGTWTPCIDRSILADTYYLAVTYRHSDFVDKEALETMVQKICVKEGIKAYWIDFACTGKTPEEKNEDLYRIADVFRNAKATLIMIKGNNDHPLSEGWKSWGTRIWTFPEALLSDRFLVQSGTDDILIKEMTLNQVANHAYGSADERQRLLVRLYSNKGKDFSRFSDRLEMLCEAIWGRQSGPDYEAAQSLSGLTAHAGEKIYALMGFLLHRILPNSDQDEDEAFKCLLDANGLQCDQCPSIAYGPGGTCKLGIRSKKKFPENKSYVLPQHIPEARFDYNGSCRRTCEAGTRIETLGKIYRWLGLDGYRDENYSVHNAEPVEKANLLWLYGLAGSGKSTLAHTAAEKCDVERILGATYFCSRYTEGLSDYLNIIPTICRLLCQLDEDFKQKVSEIFGKDSDLQRVEVHRQLQKLIVEPLKAAPRFSSYVIIIDALDECSDINAGSKILAALDKYVAELKPLKFLITSRPSHDINMAFKTLDLGGVSEKVDLDKIVSSLTERDLKIILENGLVNIRKEYDCPDSWPSEGNIFELVKQAQRLVIFVSTALKFVGDSSASDPEGRLKLLLKSKMISSKSSPYTYLDNLYREVFKSAFSEMQEELRKKLQMVLGTLILGRERFSIAKLENLMGFQSGTVRRALLKLHSIVVVPDNKHADIRLIHSSIYDFLTDASRCSDSRFVVNVAVGHSIIATCCLKRLIKFKSEDALMLSYQASPIQTMQRTLRHNLSHGDDAYAYTYWIFHVERSDGQLDKSALQLLTQIVSSHRALDIIVKDNDEAVSVYLCLFRKLSHRPIPPSDVMTQLYEAVLFLYRIYWFEPRYIAKSYESLKDARATLKRLFSYNDSLYGFDSNFPLWTITVFNLAYFLPRTDVHELENVTCELRNAANAVHNFIMQQAVPEDKKECFALQECMATLHEEIRSSYDTCRKAWFNRNGGSYTEATRPALLAWIDSLKTFCAKVEQILGEIPSTNDGTSVARPERSTNTPTSSNECEGLSIKVTGKRLICRKFVE